MSVDPQFQPQLERWLSAPQTCTPGEWQSWLTRWYPLSFCPASLELNAELWGSFWQGDVIAPGYILPALEVSYLRCVRLDDISPGVAGDNPADYLQILQTAMQSEPESLWVGRLLGHLVAVVCVSGWVVWLSEGHILAAYRNQPQCLTPGFNLTPLFKSETFFKNKDEVSHSPAQPPVLEADTLLEWQAVWSSWSVYQQGDALVRLQRWYSYFSLRLQAEEPLLRSVRQFLKANT